MASQIVEITKPGYWLNKNRGFLEVWDGEEKIGSVVIEDILAVMISVQGCSVSTSLINALANLDIPLVIAGDNYLPSTITLPVNENSRQHHIMLAQANLKESKRKRGWQLVIKQKILNQGELIGRFGGPVMPFKRFANKVKSGDPENVEAQAARIYWVELFDKEFRRDRNKAGLNSALNYGYSVLRSTVARGVVAAGLHPSFSLHHRNSRNPMNLVDDLIEPFRPWVDWKIRSLKLGETINLDTQIKREIANVVSLPVLMDNESSPISYAAVKMARCYASYCTGDIGKLSLPSFASEIEMANV